MNCIIQESYESCELSHDDIFLKLQLGCISLTLISKVFSLCVTFNKRGCSGWREKIWVTDEGWRFASETYFEIYLEVIGVGILHIAVLVFYYWQPHFAQYFDIWLPLLMLILLTGCILLKLKHLITLTVQGRFHASLLGTSQREDSRSRIEWRVKQRAMVETLREIL